MELQRIARYPHRGSAAAEGRPLSVLLLPGAFQRFEDFTRNGFEQALRARAAAGAPSVELILADPDPAHLTDRAWLAQLHDEVVAPEHAEGRRLWLGGISLGGFRALRFAAEYPAAVDGLCLLAPYLGSRIVAAEIGGHERLQDWQPGDLSAEDDERRVWRYIRELQPPHPEVFLGLGSADRFADTQELLARSLPAASCIRLPGGHDWPVWYRLWEHFLDRLVAANPREPAPT